MFSNKDSSCYPLSASDSLFTSLHHMSSYSICFPSSQDAMFLKSATTSLDLSCASTFDACTTFQYIQGWLRDTQGWSQVHTVFIVCSGLHITHSIQLLQALARYRNRLDHRKLTDHVSNFLCGTYVQCANMYIHLDVFI